MKSVLTTLSGEELVQLRDELELIKDAFSLVEFDDEEVDEKKGILKILPWKRNTAQTDVTPEMIDYTFVFPDEDGSEFEREITEALEGLSVSATAEKLCKVLTPHFCVLDRIPVLS